MAVFLLFLYVWIFIFNLAYNEEKKFKANEPPTAAELSILGSFTNQPGVPEDKHKNISLWNYTACITFPRHLTQDYLYSLFTSLSLCFIRISDKYFLQLRKIRI